MTYGPLEINGKSAGITGKNTEGGGGRWLEGMIFKMEVETGENKSKKDIFWRGGGALANSIRRSAGPKKNLQI